MNLYFGVVHLQNFMKAVSLVQWTKLMEYHIIWVRRCDTTAYCTRIIAFFTVLWFSWWVLELSVQLQGWEIIQTHQYTCWMLETEIWLKMKWQLSYWICWSRDPMFTHSPGICSYISVPFLRFQRWILISSLTVHLSEICLWILLPHNMTK